LKIEILPPDVNYPSVDFDVSDGKIRFGMSAIKNVGKNSVEEIILATKKLGRNFTSIYDFCMNVDTRIVNKRALEGLVLAGAFDTVDKRRSSLFSSIEDALSFGSKVQNSKLATGDSLFGEMEKIEITEPAMREIEDWSEKERLTREREVTGFYITGHPLHRFEIEYNSFTGFHIGETENTKDMQSVKACGVVTGLRKKIDRSGNDMAFFRIDDFSGSCECLMFSKVYKEYGQYLLEEEPLFIFGNLESSGDTVKIHVNKVLPIENAREEMAQSVKILINQDKNNIEQLNSLRTILKVHEGKLPVYLHLDNNGTRGKLFLLEQFRISLSEQFINEVRILLGGDSIIINSK
jgi:DNA polymerase-3 subunit alpha